LTPRAEAGAVIGPRYNRPYLARTRIALAAVLLAVAWSVAAPAADRSRIVIHAVVLAVDPARSLVAVHQEALETRPAVDRLCRLKHQGDVRRLQRGTVIEAIAETAHDPWVLDEVRVRAHTVLPSASSAAT
jgi:hypothetical protein